MTILQILKRVERLVADNSPVILTAVGVAGTVGTAVLAGKATLKADRILKADYRQLCREVANGEPTPTKRDYRLHQAKLVWKEFVPPVAVGTLTVTSIIFSNRISSKRAAALATAYTVLDNTFGDYKEKVVEVVGKNKEEKVREAVARERMDENPSREVIIMGDAESLCFDVFSARYFKSTMEDLKRAQNDINYQILQDDYATLADFYTQIKLKTTPMSYELGWNHEAPLDLVFTTVMSEDQKPCIGVEFRVAPIRGYANFR